MNVFIKLLLLTGVGAGTILLLSNQRKGAFAISAPFQAGVRAEATKIPIDPKRWYQLNAPCTGMDALFDGVTNVNVNTGYGKVLGNYDSYYPLLDGEQMTIERIRFFDFEGVNTDAPMTLSIINDKWERIPIATFIGDTYNRWVGPDPANHDEFALKTSISGARYIVLNTNSAYPTEIEFYGSYQPGVTPSVIPPPSVPLRQLIGVNAFEWDFEGGGNPLEVGEDRMQIVNSFAGVRHYMDWEKIEPSPGEYTFNPTTSGSWNYDAIYERCKAEGIEVLACLKSIPGWMQESYPPNQRDGENVPARYGSDLSSPASYVEQARAGFQYIARYGRNKNVNPALVKVSSSKTWAGKNEVKIGMGLIRYIECENERDKWWKGRKAYQTGREYAANLSAFYDGHKNTLGPGIGVKNADPSVKVVIGGVASATTDYVRAMIDWCKEFRGYRPDGTVDVCWDVINQHLYANDASSSQNGASTRGAAPERTEVGAQAAAFVTLAHQFSNDQPVWITEAGYDLNQGSPLKAIPIGDKTALETQADWLLRTALLYARVGIGRLFFYQLYDDNPQSTIQFGSMGLANANQTRRPATDYLLQTRKLLGDYYYKETISKDPLVDRYELDGQSAYVLLIPDEQGRTQVVNLPIPVGDTVQICTPAIGQDDMTRSLQISHTGTISLNVSETPLFVIPLRAANREAINALSGLKIYPNPTTGLVQITLENGNTSPVDVTIYDASGRKHRQLSLPKPTRMLDEQLDLSFLPAGMYRLDVQQGRFRAVKKLIRTH